jgi:acyl-CoA thioesterase
MSLALLAAYDTLPPGFHIHYLAAQFFFPGHPVKTLTFSVNRSSDRAKNASRSVSVCQGGRVISSVTMDFTRHITPDGLSLHYQSWILESINPPVEHINELNVVFGDLICGQRARRVMSESRVPVI